MKTKTRVILVIVALMAIVGTSIAIATSQDIKERCNVDSSYMDIVKARGEHDDELDVNLRDVLCVIEGNWERFRDYSGTNFGETMHKPQFIETPILYPEGKMILDESGNPRYFIKPNEVQLFCNFFPSSEDCVCNNNYQAVSDYYPKAEEIDARISVYKTQMAIAANEIADIKSKKERIEKFIEEYNTHCLTTATSPNRAYLCDKMVASEDLLAQGYITIDWDGASASGQKMALAKAKETLNDADAEIQSLNALKEAAPKETCVLERKEETK